MFDYQERSVLLSFYPTGVEESVQYSISVAGDILTVKDFSFRSSSEVKEYSTQLSNDQMNMIDQMISVIKKENRIYSISYLCEDTWGASLKINDIIFFESSDFSFKSPSNETIDFINYLVSLSSIKIELYGFA